MGDTLTEDYWEITLSNELETSSARSPSLFAYYAALNILDAPVLFSHKKVRDLFDPGIQSTRSALERHHLFPRAWLERNGIDDLKVINQIANFALLEWPDNMEISDSAPADYVPMMQERVESDDLAHMYAAHGMPQGWEAMDYETFLTERLRLLSTVIRMGYEALA